MFVFDQHKYVNTHFYYCSLTSSYIHYSNIAARALRSSLKPELQADALKRAESHVKFTKWTEGKPARK